MQSTLFPGEVRPSTTSDRPSYGPPDVPFARLRRRDRQVIQPEACLLKDCPVCAWRRAGLLDAPTTVVRDGPPEAYCPGCNRSFCACPSDAALALREGWTYELGHSHGEADGPENRPTRRWLLNAGLDPAPYLEGYDDACAGVACVPATVNKGALAAPLAGPLWNQDEDDRLPF